MKKILPVLFILTMLFAGCSKKNDTPDASVRIIGKWKGGASTVIYTTAGKEVYRVTTSATATNDYSEFRSGGVLANFTYVATSNTYTESDNSWAISGTTLHIAIQGQTSDYTFNFADDNTLNLSLNTSGTFPYPTGNTTANADNITLNVALNKF